MSLTEQLNVLKNKNRKQLPDEVVKTMNKATEELSESEITQHAPKSGQTISAFSLPNAKQEIINLSDLLHQGPVVLTFYRGGWCPYCNLELRAYQAVLADIQSAGATLVAVTPELPDASLSTAEKNELQFEVLSDVDSKYARSLGIVFTLPEELKEIYKDFGIHIEAHNGMGQFDLPLAATFIIKQDGVISSAFVDADYTKRKEPSEVIEELKKLV